MAVVAAVIVLTFKIFGQLKRTNNVSTKYCSCHKLHL